MVTHCRSDVVHVWLGMEVYWHKPLSLKSPRNLLYNDGVLSVAALSRCCMFGIFRAPPLCDHVFWGREPAVAFESRSLGITLIISPLGVKRGGRGDYLAPKPVIVGRCDKGIRN